VNDYLERENISLVNGSAAYYTPSLDQVTVPEMKTFRSIESYYSTLFHECGHSTGHESRLNRKDNKQVVKFGDPIYAQEELVAEMTNAFLGGETGVTSEVEADQRVAYIQSWLKALRNDKKMVVMAAAQAQKAADLILDRKVA
jgi:antirestriction protein ArdC